MVAPTGTIVVHGAGKVFRHDKEICAVQYTVTYEQGKRPRIINGSIKVVDGRTDLLGSSRLTLYLADGSPVIFGVSGGNIVKREFVMDMNNKSS